MADVQWAETRARELIAQHAPGVEFTWTRAKTVHGQTRFHVKDGVPVKTEIQLSKPATHVVSEAEVEDTILHEIAHVLAGIDVNHGPEWRSIARRLGASVDNHEVDAATNLRRAMAPWVGTCPNGHEIPYRYYRKPKNMRSCYECSPTFQMEYLITYRDIRKAN